MDICHDKESPINCNDHGICQNTNNTEAGYICLCEPGWVGANCETGKFIQNVTSIDQHGTNLYYKIIYKHRAF